MGLLFSQYEKAFREWRLQTGLLHRFADEKEHLQRAREFAQENPDKLGFILFPLDGGKGFWFYRIEAGKATPTTAFHIFLEFHVGMKPEES